MSRKKSDVEIRGGGRVVNLSADLMLFLCNSGYESGKNKMPFKLYN